jgi:hypothetical protein
MAQKVEDGRYQNVIVIAKTPEELEEKILEKMRGEGQTGLEV